jgi:hypothetical protein
MRNFPHPSRTKDTGDWNKTALDMTEKLIQSEIHCGNEEMKHFVVARGLKLYSTN